MPSIACIRFLQSTQEIQAYIIELEIRLREANERIAQLEKEVEAADDARHYGT